MKRFIRRRRQAEAGFTLIEVTLTLLILSVVMVLAFDFLDRTSMLTMRTQAHAQTEQDAQLALRVVTEHLRGAAPIGDPCASTSDTPTTLVPGPLPVGYPNCIQFSVKRTTSGLDPCARTEFLFAIVGTGDTKRLIENRREHTGTGTTAATCSAGTWRKRRILLEKVANTAAEPLFTYYSDAGTPIDPTSTTAVKRAASIRVTLAVRFKEGATSSVFTDSVALRNNLPR